MGDDFDFSTPELNQNYSIQDGYQETAMDGIVYKLTNTILDSIFLEPLLSNVTISKINLTDPNTIINVMTEDWQEIITTNWRFCTAIVFGFIMAIIMPLAGLIWCCSKCCCKSSRKERQNSDGLLLGVGVFALLVTTLLFGLFGNIWFFASQQVLVGEVQNLKPKIESGLGDVNIYLNNTIDQIEYLGNDNFNEVRFQFNSTLDRAMTNLKGTVDEITNDIHFNELISTGNFIIDKALSFNDVTLVELDQILLVPKNFLTTVKAINISSSGLLNTQPFCDILTGLGQGLSCSDLLSIINSIASGSAAIEFPETSSLQIPPASVAAIEAFKGQLSEAEKMLNDFSSEIVGDYSVQVNDELDKIGEDIKNEIEKITSDLHTGLDTNIGQEDAFDYAYVGVQALVAPMIVLCIILAIIFLGSVLGCCGSVGGSVKGCGSTLLTVSLTLLFLFGFFLWLFTTVVFFSGAVTEKIVCDTIRDPENSEFGKQLDKILDDTIKARINLSISVNLTYILNQCEDEGEAIYTLLDLKSVVDVDEWAQKFNIEDIISTLNQTIDTTITSLVDTAGRVDLNNANVNNVRNLLIDAQTNFFDKSNINISDFISLSDINKFYDDFKTIRDNVSAADPSSPFLSEIDSTLTKLETLKTDYAKLEESLKDLTSLGREQLSDANGVFLADLIGVVQTNLSTSVTYLDGAGRRKVFNLTDQTIEEVRQLVDKFITYSIKTVKEDIGRCGPIRTLYDGLLKNTLCHNIVSPFNGLWSGIGLVLVFSIPGLFLMCGLANCFAREKRRPRYAGADADDGVENYKNVRLQSLQGENRKVYQVPDHYKGKNNLKK